MISRRRMQTALVELGWSIAPFAAVIAAWQAFSFYGELPRYVLPSPLAVARASWELVVSGELLRHTLESFGRMLLGIAISIPSAVALGVVMAMRKSIAEFLTPLLTAMNAVSGIAWIPLAMIWFGLGSGTVTFILWNTIFFLVLFNTIVGVAAVPRVYEQAILTLGGSKRDVVWSVLLPGAMPNIIAGVRVGIGFGWRALIAVEMIVSPSGLGYMIFDAAAYQRSEVILVGILIIGVLWIVIDRIVFLPLERWTVYRWGTITTPA